MPVKAIVAGSAYYIESQSKELIDNLKTKGEAEIHNFFADEVAPEDLFNTLFTVSLFADIKIVFLHKAELFKKSDAFFSDMAKTEHTAVIITTADLKKAASLHKLLPGFTLHTEKKKSPSDLSADIRKLFKNKGLEINTQTAGIIGNMLEWDMSKAEQEAEKLSLYYAYTPKLSNQDILNHLDGEPHETLWKFIDHFLAKRPDQCIKIYTLLPDPEANSSQIFYMLITYLAGLYFRLTFPALANAKNPLFHGKTYFMNAVEQNKGLWNPEEVKKMIAAQKQLDWEIKTGKIDVSDALLVLIHKL